MLTRIFKAKGEKIEGGKLRFKITDESKDRHGTVIKMDGWDFSAFENNPTVFYQHGLTTGLLSINDALRLEDMDTIGPEGDERYINAASVPLSKLYSGG